MLKRLQLLSQLGQLHDIDYHFARLIKHIEPGANDELLLAAALASFSLSDGHSCLSLAAHADSTVFDGVYEPLVTPELSHWRDCLFASTVVGIPGDITPLVLDEMDRLYLNKYWQYERSLADGFLQRSTSTTELELSKLQHDVRDLFPEQDVSSAQALAAIVACHKKLCVISGGPGTGKTTTVLRLLVLLKMQHADNNLRIAMAAPTGKAAARMQASIKQGLDQLSLEPAVKEAIPVHALTLHRLLGYHPEMDNFRYHQDNPLPIDVLVVDEFSMVDLSLMVSLLQALPEQCRLILLGDRNQLASVEAGALLGDLCSGWKGYSETLASVFSEHFAMTLTTDTKANSLSDCIVLLTRSYRFSEDSGIAALAAAVVSGESEQAIGILESSDHSDLTWISTDENSFNEKIVSGYRDYLQLIQQTSDKDDIFQAFQQFRILCATRRGEFGVDAMNERVSRLLTEAGLLKQSGNFFCGQPVMVMSNDYELKLFNGDVGLVLTNSATGDLQVWFELDEGGYIEISPERLPQHDTVFAMTIHKSQGSEFKQVMLILPDVSSPLLTRELFYTGITRTRQYCTVVARRDVIETACNSRVQRDSGLADKLWIEKSTSNQTVC